MNELNTYVDNNYSRFFFVDNRQNENLASYVRRVRAEKRLSVADVANKSGNEISGAYVNKIENDIHGAVDPSLKKLQALAKGLGVSSDEILAVAQGQNPNGKTVLDEGLARGLDKLSPGKRKLALRQINGILESLADSEDDFDYGDFGDEK